MPVYEYQCTECGQVEEAFQKISDPPLDSCAHCKGALKKLISHSSFHLKGSGWYVTDYGGAKNGGNGASGSQAKTDSGTAKSSDKKTASAAEKTSGSDA